MKFFSTGLFGEIENDTKRHEQVNTCSGEMSVSTFAAWLCDTVAFGFEEGAAGDVVIVVICAKYRAGRIFVVGC